MNTEVMFSSLTCEWPTPQWIFDELNEEFHFTLDACASADNAKCDRWLDAGNIWSGLAEQWEGRVWCNPPYGRGIGEWLSKAYESAYSAAEVVVMLLPARTDTAWFHDYAMKADEIRFIRGRLKFGDAKHNAPFPSMVVVFKARKPWPKLR